jgi:hypothetical protein
MRTASILNAESAVRDSRIRSLAIRWQRISGRVAENEEDAQT